MSTSELAVPINVPSPGLKVGFPEPGLRLIGDFEPQLFAAFVCGAGADPHALRVE